MTTKRVNARFELLAAVVLSECPLSAALKEPYAYLLQIPGKRIRSKLIDAFDVWLKIPADVKSEVKGASGRPLARVIAF